MPLHLVLDRHDGAVVESHPRAAQGAQEARRDDNAGDAVCGEGDVLRANERNDGAIGHRIAEKVEATAVEGDLAVNELGGHPVAEANKVGNECVGRRRVELLWRADLLDAAVAHDSNSVGNGERFFLVVGHKHCRDAEFGLETTDLFAQLHAHFGVEGAQGLVEQENTRASD